MLACNPDLAAHVMTQLHLGGRVAAPSRIGRVALAALAVAVIACIGSGIAGWTAGAMASQAETPRLDEVEVRRQLKLQLPRLPREWRLIDAQVYPTDEGPGLNLVMDVPRHGRLNLFAVRANTFATDRPEIATRGREAVAFWERGDSAYVLSGNVSRGGLLSEARMLAGWASL
jgi:hypothetical protein